MEKRCAVEKEDYDLAKHKKRQMEQYRAWAFEQLHSLVDTELVGTARAGGLGARQAVRVLAASPVSVPYSLADPAVPG